MTPDRHILPIAPEEFSGKIGTTYADSEPAYPDPLNAPDGAPNVVVIMLDDVGFGQTSMFGGAAATPQARQRRHHLQPVPHHRDLFGDPSSALDGP